MLIKKLKESDGNQRKIEVLDEASLENVSSKLLRSKLYEFFGDVLNEVGDLDRSQKSYLTALELSSNSFHIAILNFKVSQTLFYQQKFDLAYEYILKSLEYDFQDLGIAKKVNTLKGRLIQSMQKS